jgi:MFS superfamily sulfate permease-like transporter
LPAPSKAPFFLYPVKYPLGIQPWGLFLPKTKPSQRRITMIWIILIIAGALLIKLGALSVLVSVLAFSLKAVIGLVAALGLFMLWLENRKE